MKREVKGVDMLVLHQRIVQLRKTKKVTQEIMADKIGVTRSALSQYELGLRQPDYEIVKRMADYFNVSTDDLLGREKLVTAESTAEKEYLANLIINIEDPIKKKQAIAYLEFLANSPTDGAK